MAKKETDKGTGTKELIIGLLPYIIIFLFALAASINGVRGFAAGSDTTYGLEAAQFALLMVFIFANAFPLVSVPIMVVSGLLIYKGVTKKIDYYKKIDKKKKHSK